MGLLVMVVGVGLDVKSSWLHTICVSWPTEGPQWYVKKPAWSLRMWGWFSGVWRNFEQQLHKQSCWGGLGYIWVGFTVMTTTDGVHDQGCWQWKSTVLELIKKQEKMEWYWVRLSTSPQSYLLINKKCWFILCPNNSQGFPTEHSSKPLVLNQNTDAFSPTWIQRMPNPTCRAHVKWTRSSGMDTGQCQADLMCGYYIVLRYKMPPPKLP